MDFTLDSAEVRIIGSLIEKESTTPDYYPLSLNALVNACNQKSNREPILHLAEDEVESTLEILREKHLVWKRTVTGARVSKYEHNIKSIITLSDPELAVLCIVMLRGAQTVGEIRSRSERLYSFTSIAATESTIRNMIESSEDRPALLLELPRQPGRKEPRYIHLLSGEEWAQSQAGESAGSEKTISDKSNTQVMDPDKLATVEEEVAYLREEVAQLRGEIESFRKLLE